jgi:hypothetical protein
MSLEHQPHPSPPLPSDFWVLRLLGTLMSVVVVGVGYMAYATEHAPPASTRFGMTGPLDGEAAVEFGITIMTLGLMPLAFWARTARGAGWWATLTLGGALLHLAWSLWR